VKRAGTLEQRVRCEQPAVRMAPDTAIGRIRPVLLLDEGYRLLAQENEESVGAARWASGRPHARGVVQPPEGAEMLAYVTIGDSDQDQVANTAPQTREVREPGEHAEHLRLGVRKVESRIGYRVGSCVTFRQLDVQRVRPSFRGADLVDCGVRHGQRRSAGRGMLLRRLAPRMLGTGQEHQYATDEQSQRSHANLSGGGAAPGENG
jgi:hypothetical protein